MGLGTRLKPSGIFLLKITWAKFLAESERKVEYLRQGQVGDKETVHS